MTVLEVKTEKEELKKNIEALIIAFEQRTLTKISDIKYEEISTRDNRGPITLKRIEVMINI